MASVQPASDVLHRIVELKYILPPSPVILDGGLGTTLEDHFCVDISHTPLWSAKPIAENPEAIIGAHIEFLRAGAQIILTSTYQCSLNTFNLAGYKESEAHQLMLKSVELARKAKAAFLEEVAHIDEGQRNHDIRIALSLGPFGASLSPTQEFDGYYPPPYGPKEYTSSGDNYNSFDADGDAELRSIDALARFHFERLLIFAKDSQTWNAIDCLSFETVPLTREVKAIRVAMAWLQQNPAFSTKPWWITFVFPGGKSPAERSRGGGDKLNAQDLVNAALQRYVLNPSVSANGTAVQAGVPSGIGINCTAIEYLPELIHQMTEAVKALGPSLLSTLWLVVYPNGGDVYDPITRTWKVEGQQGALPWAERLADIIGGADVTWGGIVVGGCCRTGPGHIQQLADSLEK